jgi:hypothetical protein
MNLGHVKVSASDRVKDEVVGIVTKDTHTQDRTSSSGGNFVGLLQCQLPHRGRKDEPDGVGT